MEYRQRKTRIQHRSINEITVVPILSEDLQDQFEKLQDSQNEKQTAAELLIADPHNAELSKNFFLLNGLHFIRKFTFWRNLRSRYGLWSDALGIRDGYEVVKKPQPQIFCIDPECPEHGED